MMMRWLLIWLALWLPSTSCVAQSATALYQQALQQAASGKLAVAESALLKLSAAASTPEVWQQRSQAAAVLLHLWQARASSLPASNNPYLRLANRYAEDHHLAKQKNAALLFSAALIPGAGHALLGRWHDARTAFILVVPMLLLTLWAAKRRMGPVTVFFALITLWLWSGTVFSAWSLHERQALELYSLWWQGLWQASALPGHLR